MLRIIPIFRKVDAVYFFQEGENEELLRVPVFGIQVDEYGNLKFFEADETGWFDTADGNQHFLGYEFDSKQKHWIKEIKDKKLKWEKEKSLLAKK